MTAQRAEKLAARRNKRRKKKIEQKFPLFANDPAIAPKEVTAADLWIEYDKLIARFIRMEIEEVRKCFEANILLKHVTHDFTLEFLPIPLNALTMAANEEKLFSLTS